MTEANTTYYSELHRPQFHFSPDSMWMNDPNGMVYFDGEYHLFYQHYPENTVWGPMHWGHAVTKDLVHWQHLPIALYPDSMGYIFSGSAVVDVHNTSGFGVNGEPPMVAIFTHHNAEEEKTGSKTFQNQSIAYSTDKGRTWTKYEGNPVVPNPGIRDFRDPKVFWHEASKRWVMIFAAGDRIRLYNSPNLKDWEFSSEFGAREGSHGGVWECPDLFELPVEGTKETRWLMLLSINPGGPNGGSATQYFIGDFDGKTFTNDHASDVVLWLDYGKDNYAGVTWSNLPKADNRRLFLGWMSNWQYANAVPTDRWRSAMTIARTLSLRVTPQGIRVASKPVKELQELRTKATDVAAQEIAETLDLLMRNSLAELELEFDLSKTPPAEFGVRLSNSKGETVLIGYESATNRYFIDRSKSGKIDFSEDFAKERQYAPRFSTDRTLKLHLFIDVASVELFADDGLSVLTSIFFPTENFTTAQIYSKTGSIQLTGGKVYELKTIW